MKIKGIKILFKRILSVLLILSWLLTGWLRINFIDFPPIIKEAQAAAATGLYCEKVTDTTASSTTWVDICEIAAGSFTAGKTYLIVASAYISASGATNEARVRLVHGGTPTVFTDASAAYEETAMTASAGNRTAYGYMTVYTQPGTAELVKLQISNSSTDTTTAEMGQIFALKLSDDLVQNTDWCYTEVTADYSTESAFSDTSSTDAASCSLTANGTTDNYLAITNAMVDIAATNSNHMMSLYESVSNTDEPAIDLEGEDATNEYRSYLLARAYTPSAATHTWQPRFNDESTTHVIMSSRIFVLKLNKFAQHSYSYLINEEQPAATPNWTTTRTLSVTPDVTGNWFIMGTFTNDVGALTDDLFTRLQVNDGGGLTSDPNYGDNAPHEDSWDATDVVPFQIFKMRSLTSGASRTINIDTQMNSGTTLRVQERNLVAFSLELSPAYLTQNDFEFWEDSTLLTPTLIWGNPDITENTALVAVPPANDPIDPSDEIRLRMNVSVTVTDLASGTEGFILAYSEAQDCTTASSWTDVDAAGGGGIWRFSSNTDIADGTALTTLLVSTSEIEGRYSRSDPTSTNSIAVAAGQEMEWDWHVQYNGSALAATYCFRMERDDGTTLNAYNSDSYPRVDIRPGMGDFMRHGNFFSSGIERGFFWAD